MNLFLLYETDIRKIDLAPVSDYNKYHQVSQVISGQDYLEVKLRDY